MGLYQQQRVYAHSSKYNRLCAQLVFFSPIFFFYSPSLFNNNRSTLRRIILIIIINNNLRESFFHTHKCDNYTQTSPPPVHSFLWCAVRVSLSHLYTRFENNIINIIFNVINIITTRTLSYRLFHFRT